MKKNRIMSFAAVFLLLIGLCACGAKTQASAKAVSVAKQAVEIADNYLDGKIKYEKATEQLDDLDMSYAYEDKSASHTADVVISSDLTILKHNILMDKIDKTSESYNKVLEARNEIAKDAGLKTRK